MAGSTIPHPTHQRIGSRLAVAALVMAVAVTALLVLRSRHSGTSVKPSAPAIAVPGGVGPGLAGTANRGPDNPAVASASATSSWIDQPPAVIASPFGGDVTGAYENGWSTRTGGIRATPYKTGTFNVPGQIIQTPATCDEAGSLLAPVGSACVGDVPIDPSQDFAPDPLAIAGATGQ